jgi:hypothetical protein
MPVSVSSRPGLGLERAFRPFLPAQGRPDRKRVYYNGGSNSNGRNKDTEGSDIPSLEWEALAPVQVVTLAGVGFTVDLGGDGSDKIQDETTRETEVVRIFSDSDPSAYIDVERIKRIDFKNESKLTRRFNLRSW